MYQCPECGKGQMQETTIQSHNAQLHGITFNVEYAKIHVCDQCKKINVNAEELKRWNHILIDQTVGEFVRLMTKIDDTGREVAMTMLKVCIDKESDEQEVVMAAVTIVDALDPQMEGSD